MKYTKFIYLLFLLIFVLFLVIAKNYAEKKKNKYVLFLESSASIGIMDLNNISK